METMPPDKLGKGKASKKVKAKNSSLNTLASSSKSSDSGATMTIDKESRCIVYIIYQRKVLLCLRRKKNMVLSIYESNIIWFNSQSYITYF